MTYEELCSFEVLYKAYLEARKGKRSKSKTIEYEAQALACTEKLSRKLAVCNVRQPDGSIRQQIPDDAKFKAEVTNNALDSSPVWQDATTEVKKGVNIVFENKTATNGAAFNFRVSVERGESGEGGYIEAVSGAFE